MKTIHNVMFAVMMFFVGVFGVAEAASYDVKGEELNYTLTSTNNVVVSQEDIGGGKALVLRWTDKAGDGQMFAIAKLPAKSPVKVWTTMKDISGGYNAYPNGLAIQWYFDDENKAREIFEDEQRDTMVIGREGSGMYSALYAPFKDDAAKFTITTYNYGFDGNFVVQQISPLFGIDVALKIKDVLDQDPAKKGFAFATSSQGAEPEFEQVQ